MYCLEENVLWHRKGAIWEDQAKAVQEQVTGLFTRKWPSF